MPRPIIKYINSDFLVREVSLIPSDLSDLTGRAEHTVVELVKEGYTTFEAMSTLAKFFHIEKSDVHCQGLKDEDGVTTQLISIAGVHLADSLQKFSEDHKALEKGWISLTLKGYSRHPLVEKKLHANVFTVTIRNLSSEQADRINAYCNTHSDCICLNYYDQQRFGLPTGPYVAHEIGKAIINGEWDDAKQLYLRSGNAEIDYPDGLPVGFDLRQLDTRKLQFFISAHSSARWNKQLSELIDDTQTSFDIFSNFTLSALDNPQQKLSLILADVGYRLMENFSVTEHPKNRSTIISTTIYCSSVAEDDLHDGYYRLTLDFILPTGSYATMAIKQLFIQCAITEWQIGNQSI